MGLVDLSGAYDLHIHANAELSLRIGDDLDIAQSCVPTVPGRRLKR